MLIINIKELVGIVEDGSLMKAGAAMSEVNRIENIKFDYTNRYNKQYHY